MAKKKKKHHKKKKAHKAKAKPHHKAPRKKKRKAPTGGLDLKAISKAWHAAGKPGTWLGYIKSHKSMKVGATHAHRASHSSKAATPSKPKTHKRRRHSTSGGMPRI